MQAFIAKERLRVSGVGRVEAGQQFTVDDLQAKRMSRLESKGLIARHYATPIHRAAAVTADALKALVGYENRAVAPAENRMTVPAKLKGGRR